MQGSFLQPWLRRVGTRRAFEVGALVSALSYLTQVTAATAAAAAAAASASASASASRSLPSLRNPLFESIGCASLSCAV